MYTVYILKSEKDNRTYVGFTNDFPRRLKEHNGGKVKSTKYRTPFTVIYTEEFEDSITAKQREAWWKSSNGRRKLKQIYADIIDAKGEAFPESFDRVYSERSRTTQDD